MIGRVERVLRVDQPASVIVLDNGQMYQMIPQSLVLVKMGFRERELERQAAVTR